MLSNRITPLSVTYSEIYLRIYTRTEIYRYMQLYSVIVLLENVQQ